MKILVLTPYFYPHIGGSERYIEGLYGELIRQHPAVQVDILTYGHKNLNREELYKGFNIYRVNGWEILPNQFVLPNYFELISLLKRLKKKNYTYVNAHTRFFDTAWWGWLVAKCFNAESILTDHCADHPQHKSFIVRMIARLIDHLVMPSLYRVYQQITVVSQATRVFWVEIVGQSKKIKVIPNSVSKSLLTKKKTADHRISVRFIGRNVATKGALIFNQVADSLQSQYPDVIFESVDGLSHDKLMHLLQQTTILVHPSLHHEGLPTIIMEAGLAGCAVVATDVGGTKELIENGKSGILVEANAKNIMIEIQKLLDNLDKAKGMGQKLRKKVLEKYVWNKTVKQYGALLFK